MRFPDVYIVTGALGWLGKRLVRLLASRSLDHPWLRALPPAHIRCLVMPGQAPSELQQMGESIEAVTGDLRTADDCARLCEGARNGVIIHTAGIIHPRRIRELYAVNVEGTRNLLGAAAAAGIRRAVIVSSNSPMGYNPHADHLFDEDSPYSPYMNYGRSKMLMEQVAHACAPWGAMETVIIRAPWFYGPDQPPRQTLFFSMIRRGKVPLVGDGNNLRSMAYVDNLCQGLLLAALTTQAAGRVYWIADRRPYSMNEIIGTVERLLEEEYHLPVAHKRLRMPSIVGDVAELADFMIQRLGFYHQKIHVLSEMNKTIACSTAKAEKELQYSPTIALEEGMRRSIAWCLEQGLSI
jgi:nucleoside-diphosphate-sugar epimerase